MTRPRIAIVISTTREGRFGDRPARWIKDIAEAKGGADYEIVDLRDHPLPLFDEARSPMWQPPTNEAALAWGRRIAAFDGFVFVTAEYNHGVPAVLKNALDYSYPEWIRKPAAFVAYGAAGGARAVEQLRLILVELQVVPLRNAVHVGMAEFMAMLQQGKDFSDFLAQSAGPMLDDLLWMTATLRAGRAAAEQDAAKAAA